MYNIDDAIAKIDGYVISIAGGGPFVGESKLIKIDEVKRTAAYAEHRDRQRRARDAAARAQADRPKAPAAKPAERSEPVEVAEAATTTLRRRRAASYNRTAPRADAAGAAEAVGGVLALGAPVPAAPAVPARNDLRDHRNGRQAVPRRGGRLDPGRPRRRGRGREGLAPRAAVRRRQDRGDGRGGPRQGQGRGGRDRALEGQEDPGRDLPPEEAPPKRQMGHRSHLSRIEIKKITGPAKAATGSGADARKARPDEKEARSRWHIRRDLDRAATAATPRRSAWA